MEVNVQISPTKRKYKQLPRSQRPPVNKFGMPSKNKPVMVYLDADDYAKIKAISLIQKKPMSILLRDAALQSLVEEKL